MNIKKRFFLLFVIFFLFIKPLFSKSPFMIYYGDNISFSYINSFKEVVLDPDHFDYVYGIKAFKYGYISIGEVESFREYFDFVKGFGVLKGENPNWKGAYYVSLKSGKWQEFAINYVIPSILAKGYNGLFLDTVDSLISTGENIKDIVNFINAINSRFPKIKVIMNRGFKIADKVKVDGILFESTITSYNFKTKKYFFLNKKINYKIPKNIKKYSIDYWYDNDIKSIKKIYNIAIKRGFIPYVAEISLQKIPPIRYDIDKKDFIFNK